MKKDYVILSCLLLCVVFSAQPQVTIKGRVSNKEGEPQLAVSVILQRTSSTNVLSYVFTGDDGNYQIQYQGVEDSLTLSVSGFNIAKQSKKIPAKTQTVDFTIHEEDIVLEEVHVKAERAWNSKDTINYLVSSFSNSKDVVIGDVLKKMPGINVSENGAISYQGRAINKFYIENLDLLGGRYGIATNNISAKDVATVQVLENHQPIKALDSIRFSSDPAINLKLKDSAKGTLSTTAQLGIGGVPLIWDNGLTGMYFARKKQNISTYKGNNSGYDLKNELRSFTSRDYFGVNNLLNVRMPSPPQISQNRYLFNNSNAITINNLVKTGKDTQLNLNLIYLNDYETRRGESKTVYYFPGDSIYVIDEKMEVANNTDHLEAELRYNRDNSNNYLNNYLRVEGDWSSRMGDVTTPQVINQTMKQPIFTISNTFHVVKKREEGKGFELNSSTGFKSSPQSLTIYPGLYDSIFNQGLPYSSMQQNVHINHFFINGTFSLLSFLRIGNVLFDPNFGISFENKSLLSDICVADSQSQLFPLSADSLRNQLNWIKYTGKMGLNIRYMYNRLKLEIGLPISYSGINADDRVTEDNNYFSKPFFGPSLSLNYQLTSKISTDLNYSFYNQLGDINSFYSGYIMQNYRNLNRYDDRLQETHGNGGSFAVNYKDVINLFFVRGQISYNRQINSFLYDQTFQDILIRTSAIEQENAIENISVNGKVSKGFDLMQITTALEATLGSYSSQLLRQNELVDYENSRLNIVGSLSANLTSWLLFSYQGSWSQNGSRIKSQEDFSPITTFVNTVSTDFILPKDIRFTINYECFYNNSARNRKYLYFADFGTNYTWKKINFSLNWINIFNTDNYITSYFGDLNAYQNIYQIRPSMILLKMKFKL